MKATLSPSDIFEIRKTSLISNNDYEYALDLYAPIIGIKNVSIYFALIAEEANIQKPHTEFLAKYGISAGDLARALSYLEGIGLIKTYQKTLEEKHVFLYCIMAPRTPAEFFDNELLHGTLRSFVGVKGCRKIAEKYATVPFDEQFEDISEAFVDVFHLDLSNASMLQTPKTTNRVLGNLELGFDTNVFFETLKQVNPFIKKAYITGKEMERVSRIAALYHYEESTMASFVAESYVPSRVIGKRINFDHLDQLTMENNKYEYLHKESVKPTNSEIRGNAPTARVIRLMDRTPTLEFLVMLQRGNKPADSDVRLINTLVADMGVPQSVANALILYVLKIKEDALSSGYVTKLGASLVRAGITNALDAMNYLGKGLKKNSNGKIEFKPTEPVQTEEPTPEPEPIEKRADEPEDVAFDEEEFEKLVKNGGRK